MWFRRKDTTPLVTDLRGLPTHECICGSNVFKIIACFEDYEIILYGLNAECYDCGNLLTVPCPADRPYV